MTTHRLVLWVIAVLCTSGSPSAFAEPSKPGFLVVAPDRGFLGNQEVAALVRDFKKDYPAALGLVGRDYTGVDGEYAVYLSRAVQELKQAGATEIVAIPLFLSAADPLLKRVMPTVPAYAGGLSVRWASAMADDYLIGQVMLDRVNAVSQQAETERLILVGTGAVDEASEQLLKADVDKLRAYVNRYRHFRESESIIYYDRDTEGAEKKNQQIKAHVLAQIAKQGRTLIVPAFIGPKFDHSMALSAWLEQQFKPLHAAYQRAELLPHPNVLLWLKKTANRFVAAGLHDIGVVIMPHGSTQPWNDAVEGSIAPLKARYRIEMAYGMGDPDIIQEAVSKLEQQGVKRIVFVRMYALAHQMKPLTDYILGLSEQTPSDGHGGGHDHGAPPPSQVRTAILFSTFGGYEQYPEIVHVLHTRIAEMSKDPANETVLLVAHGEATDEGNDKWLSVMNSNIAALRKDPHCAKLKAIKAVTVREDWPKEREKAVTMARTTIEDAAKQGRVLVVANRLYGSGPYKKMLKGLDFEMNEKGLVHPVITRWLEDGIGQASMALTKPLDSLQRLAQQ
jgi:sirohydrochlorin ferrochelatase